MFDCNKMAENIHVSTRFMLLSSDKIHLGDRQKLVNDMVKGNDKYHWTIAVTLRFIQYHIIQGKQKTNIIPKKETLHKVDEVALSNVGDDEGGKRAGPKPDIEPNKASKL